MYASTTALMLISFTLVKNIFSVGARDGNELAAHTCAR